MALPKSNTRLIGRSAVLEAEYETSDGEIIAKGSVVEIREIDRSGVTIKAAMCPTCRRSIVASGISRDDLTLTNKLTGRAASGLIWMPYPQNKPENSRSQCLLRVRDASGRGLDYDLKKFNSRSQRFFLNAVEDSRVVAWVLLD